MRLSYSCCALKGTYLRGTKQRNSRPKMLKPTGLADSIVPPPAQAGLLRWFDKNHLIFFARTKNFTC